MSTSSIPVSNPSILRSAFRRTALPGVLVILLACAVPALAAGSDPARLVLTNGEKLDVLGPVKHVDGLVVFRMPDGTLSSLNETLVSKVLTRKTDAAGHGRDDGDGTAARGAVLYTNDDLAPLPDPPADPDADGDASTDDTSGAGASAGDTGTNGDDSTADGDAGAQVNELRRQLQQAATARNDAYKRWICAQHEIDFDSDACTSSLLPKPDNNLSGERENDLRTSYLEAEKRVGEIQSQLRALQ